MLGKQGALQPLCGVSFRHPRCLVFKTCPCVMCRVQMSRLKAPSRQLLAQLLRWKQLRRKPRARALS